MHKLRQRWRIFIQDRAERFGGGGLAEGTLAGEHLVEDHAKSKDVAAGVSDVPRTCSGAM